MQGTKKPIRNGWVFSAPSNLILSNQFITNLKRLNALYEFISAAETVIDGAPLCEVWD
jgi:hypothetical protein